MFIPSLESLVILSISFLVAFIIIVLLSKLIDQLFPRLFHWSKTSDNLRKDLATSGIGEKDFYDIVEIVRKRKKINFARELEELYHIKSNFKEEVHNQVKKVTKHLEDINRRISEEKENINAVIRNMGEGLLVVDKSGKILMANPAAQNMLGADEKDLIGKMVKDNLKDEHLLALYRGDSAPEEVKEIELLGKDETTKRILRASNARVENEDGQTIGMMTVLSDVTKIRELDRLKSEFVSHVSHELRTPLVAMQKNLALILKEVVGKINEEQKELLSLVDENLQRLTRLINDLLDFSKIEAKKMEWNRQKADIVLLIKKVVFSFRNWALEKKIDLKAELPERPIELYLDSDRITQAVTNLVSNALKFTPANGTIQIDLKEEKNVVRISVEDTGIGIEEKDRQRIFNKFEQVKLNRPYGISGTGLGLSITKEIIEGHGGRIWVESEINKGSKFIFELPVDEKGVQ